MLIAFEKYAFQSEFTNGSFELILFLLKCLLFDFLDSLASDTCRYIVM